jgi:hypothetical protein
MGRKLTDRAFASVALEMYGGPRAAALFGWAVMAGLMAPPDADRAWFLAHGPLSQASRYRHVTELIALRDRLVELGYDLADLTAAEPTPARVLRVVTAGH